MNKSPLSHLLDLAQQREDLERQTLKAVARARGENNSWQMIANMIGGTKQAAQQRYGKAIEPLMEQGHYECSCGWNVVYPGWEAEEAMNDIAEHRDMHDREDELDDYGTEPAPLSQLDDEPATNLDADVPALDAADAILAAEAVRNANSDELARYAEDLHKSVTTPHRTSAPQADRDADETMDRIESGELDTEGFTIDWTRKLKDGRCAKCSMTHHYEGKGSTRYFWIGPQCNPTHRDDQFRPGTR